MSSKDDNRPSDFQIAPTPTSRFVGLRDLFRSFSTPDTKPSVIPPYTEPEPEPEPSQSDSIVDEEQSRTKDQDDTENVASPTPLQRFWRHARTKTTGPEELSPSKRLVPEPSLTTEHVSPSPTLSRSPSTAMDELEAVSPVPTTLTTPPQNLNSGAPSLTNEEEHPTPASLAQRIHSIIASTPAALYQPMALESPTTPNDRRTLPQSPVPGPSNLLSPMADSRFLSFLHSPKLMNSPGLGQPSVFSMLEKLQSPMSRNRELPQEGKNDGQDGHGMEVADDGSSLMLCSPLIPQRDSLVEIAETEYVSFDEAGRVIAESHRSPLHQAYTVDDINELDDVEGKSGIHHGSNDDEGPSAEDDPTENNCDVNDGDSLPNDTSGTESGGFFRWPWSKTEEERRAEQKAKEEKKKAEEKLREERRLKKLMWVPSPTKISLQTMWWGYRIYFPPPVLEILNNKQLEAAKRAAMITSALRWLLDHIPVALIPPQFQLALSLLRGLVPILGYIGSFIAWSWSAVRVFDRGYGVTLTATWLLPIALIPGTWQFYEVPPTPQVTQGETPPQVDLNETENATSSESQKDQGGPVEEESPSQTECAPEPKDSTSREPDQEQAWGSQSSTYTSKPQPPYEYWDPGPSVVWGPPPDHGYPNPMWSGSGSFHHAQSHYPTQGAYITPIPGYGTPMYGYFQPANPEQSSHEIYESTEYGPAAPPPVVINTVPLPSSRPNTPP